MKIKKISAAETLRRLDELTTLLIDAVEHGASVGFTLPLEDAEAGNYWRKVAGEIEAGGKLLIVALDESDRAIGAAQLAKESRANGRHRAEVQKLMVRHDQRGHGIGAALMSRIEEEARIAGKTLLFLDTSRGSGGAAEFYRKLDYIFVGSIPDYAADPDGHLVPNAIFYKRLVSR